MEEHVYFLTIALPLVTLLIIFGMKYMSSYQAARARAAEEQNYRALSAELAASQRETAAALADIRDGLADVRTRTEAIGTILKEVE